MACQDGATTVPSAWRYGASSSPAGKSVAGPAHPPRAIAFWPLLLSWLLLTNPGGGGCLVLWAPQHTPPPRGRVSLGYRPRPTQKGELLLENGHFRVPSAAGVGGRAITPLQNLTHLVGLECSPLPLACPKHPPPWRVGQESLGPRMGIPNPKKNNVDIIIRRGWKGRPLAAGVRGHRQRPGVSQHRVPQDGVRRGQGTTGPVTRSAHSWGTRPVVWLLLRLLQQAGQLGPAGKRLLADDPIWLVP